MKKNKVAKIEQEIENIKRQLSELNILRPGSLTRQYKNPGKKEGPYWQISYTRKMKSHTSYVRQEYVSEVRRQIAAYKKFKRLVEKWIDLGIELSNLKILIDKTENSK